MVVLVVALIGLSWLMFRKQLEYHEDHARTVMEMRPTDAITDRRLLVRCLAVLGVVMVGFSLHSALHVAPSLVALLGAGAIVLVSGAEPEEFLQEVE